MVGRLSAISLYLLWFKSNEGKKGKWMVTSIFSISVETSILTYVSDHSSSGVVSTEQAQCWRLFPHGLQCHNTIPNAQGKS